MYTHVSRHVTSRTPWGFLGGVMNARGPQT